MLGSACYIEGAMSSMLLLAYEFADDFEAGVLANANCGGTIHDDPNYSYEIDNLLLLFIAE